MEERVSNEECIGHIFGTSTVLCQCTYNKCSCVERLKIGSKIASEIRHEIFKRFGITTSCGIAWNKLLSKIVGSQNKPNQQTTIFPVSTRELMNGLPSLRKIPGIGSTTFKLLQENELHTTEDVLNVNHARLTTMFPDSPEMVMKIEQLCNGIDASAVKPSSDKPISIGLEDRFRSLMSKMEVEKKMKWLLNRLNKLLQEDGRLPRTIKVTTRDLLKDKALTISKTPTFHKESRQCKINSRLFGDIKNVSINSELKHDVVKIAMALLEKMIDFNSSFQLTLLGISVTDFVTSGKGIISYFKGKEKISTNCKPIKETEDSKELGRASSIDIANGDENCPIISANTLKRKPYCDSQSIPPKSPQSDESIKSDRLSVRNNCFNISKIENNIKKEIAKNCDPEVFLQLPESIQQELLDEDRNMTARTSQEEKLEQEQSSALATCSKLPSNSGKKCVILPSNWDSDVFNNLPEEVKSELLSRQMPSASESKNKKRPANRIENYFVKKICKRT